SPIACPPSNTPTRFWCSTKAAWSSRAPTPSSSNAAASTPTCTTCSSAMARKPPAWWFEGARVPLAARALSRLYAGAVSTRRWLYDKRLRRSTGVDVPVIVVGNHIAGDSGKTPLAIALVYRLRAEGWTPGVASRGYGREDDKHPLWVEPGTDPHTGGDEPVLIAMRTGARVRVDRDRAAAAKALADAGCNIIVCDD